MIAELQKSVIAALRGDAQLMAIVASVTDRQPPSTTPVFPCVHVVVAASGWDTDTSDGHDASVRVHTWSRSGSALQTLTIQEAIYRVLHNVPRVVTGAHVITFQRRESFWDDDPDGLTIHGVCEYRSLIDRT